MTFSIGPFGAPVGVRLPTTVSGANFLGDPNVFISAIDVSGGINASRTSSWWPAAIQVSADLITATGSSEPFTELEYSWDFGDTGTPKYTMNYKTGLLENMNTQQTGPMAAYIYDGSGNATRTITLTVKGRTIFGGIITAQTTCQFTISDHPGPHKYFNSNVVGGDGSGSSPANASTSAAALKTATNAGNYCHLAMGSTFDLNADHYVLQGGLRIDTYDSGNGTARPIMTAHSNPNPGTKGTLWGTQQFNAPDNAFVRGVELRTQDGTTTPMRIDFQTAGAGTISNMYFDDCRFDGGTINGNSNDTIGTRFGFWKVECYQNMGSGFPSGENVWMQGGAGQWQFMIGCTCNINDPGTPVGPVDGKVHWYYSGTRKYQLYRNCFYATATCDYAVNTNTFGSGGELTPYHLFSGCKAMTRFGFDASNSPSDQSSLFSNFIIQDCAFNVAHHHASTPGGSPTFFFSCVGMTFRDNNNWGNNDNQCIAPAGALATIVTIKAYRNKYYSNNSFWAVGAGWNKPHRFTDNIIFTTSTSVRPMSLTSGDIITAGGLIDRNQYWAPNFSGHPNPNIFSANSGSTGINLAAWRALASGVTLFDTNGSYANPNWIDPANGIF